MKHHDGDKLGSASTPSTGRNLDEKRERLPRPSESPSDYATATAMREIADAGGRWSHRRL